MDFVKLEIRDSVLVVTLARGKANPMNWQMVEELSEAARRASLDTEVKGVVIASESPRFFSGGFDVAEVFAYDRPKMTQFFQKFIDTYQAFFHCPKPVVAAIGGHAYAGGAVLALSCDYRVMAEGEYGFALNEINLGVALPASIANMAIDAVGYRNAYNMILTGASLTPAQALACGLSAETVPASELLDRSITLAKSLGEKAPGAFARAKVIMKKVAGRSIAGENPEELEEFMDSWFSDEAEERKSALIRSLAK